MKKSLFPNVRLALTVVLALTIVLVFCALAVVFLSPVHAAEPAAASSRPVSTTGDAEIKVAPDQVLLILGVETWDKNIRLAKNQNDDRVKKIIALTQQDFGIENKYLQTEQIQVEPRYRNGT